MLAKNSTTFPDLGGGTVKNRSLTSSSMNPSSGVALPFANDEMV
jgi:hypothetical protein